MAIFIGTFENKVDRKGRLSVPAPFRQALTGLPFQGIVAFPSRRAQTLEGCGMDLMEGEVLSKMEVDLLNDEPGTPPASIFYDLQQLAFDGEGRIVLPQAFRDFAGIDGQATFVGVGKFFQIWAPERLAAFREKTGAGHDR